MKNFTTQFAISLLFFGAVVFGLSQLPWTDWFKVEETKTTLEKSLGDLCLKTISGDEIKDSTLLNPLEKIKDRICKDNDIDSKK